MAVKKLVQAMAKAFLSVVAVVSIRCAGPTMVLMASISFELRE